MISNYLSNYQLVYSIVFYFSILYAFVVRDLYFYYLLYIFVLPLLILIHREPEFRCG